MQSNQIVESNYDGKRRWVFFRKNHFLQISIFITNAFGSINGLSIDIGFSDPKADDCAKL